MVGSITSFGSIYDQYANFQNMWPENLNTPGTGSTPDSVTSPGDLDPLANLSEEEQQILFDSIFDAALNEYLINQNAKFPNNDPELIKVQMAFKESGASFSFDSHHQEMPKFNEFAEAEEPEEKYFFPASMANDHALLEMALIDVFKAAIRPEDSSVQNVRAIDLPGWIEDCVADALSRSADIIDTTPPRFDRAAHYRPIDRDISRTMDTNRAAMGPFALRNVMTGRQAPSAQDFQNRPANNSGSVFASFAQTTSNIQIEIKKPVNQAAAFAQASAGQSSGVQVKIHYKGPQIPYTTAHNASGRFATFLADCASGGLPTDINALILWVLRESYQEGTNILIDIRERVKYFNKLKDQMRDALGKLNDIRAKYSTPAHNHVAEERKNYITKNKGKADDRVLQEDYDREYSSKDYGNYDISQENISRYVYNDNYLGRPSTFTASTNDKDKIKTLGDLERYIKEMESKMSSIGDDAQVQNINLQNAMQKQTQLIQTLSNLQKLLHDTALNVIQKIGS